MQQKILDDLVGLAFELIATVVETEGLALRLKKEQNHYPFYKYKGHSNEFIDKFINKEDCFRRRDIYGNIQLDCLCGQTIQGVTKKIKVFFTEYGSYRQNEIDMEVINAIDKQIKLHEACIQSFHSLALVPLRNKDNVLGLFHMSDHRKNLFDNSKIHALEKIAKCFCQLVLEIENTILNHRLKRYNILLVDDEPTITALLKEFLCKRGYNCVAFNNSNNAFEYIKTKKIDLLITDLDMPEMSGIELIKKIRKNFGVYGPQIVVIGGNAAKLTGLNTEEYNIAETFLKPFNLSSVHRSIENIFEATA